MKNFFYKLIFKLDSIPRYGRTYSMRPGDEGYAFGKPAWRFQKMGLWGYNMLDHLNLLDKALETLYGPVDELNEGQAPVPESNKEK
jgi:hypothetical protein